MINAIEHCQRLKILHRGYRGKPENTEKDERQSHRREAECAEKGEERSPRVRRWSQGLPGSMKLNEKYKTNSCPVPLCGTGRYIGQHQNTTKSESEGAGYVCGTGRYEGSTTGTATDVRRYEGASYSERRARSYVDAGGGRGVDDGALKCAATKAWLLGAEGAHYVDAGGGRGVDDGALKCAATKAWLLGAEGVHYVNAGGAGCWQD